MKGLTGVKELSGITLTLTRVCLSLSVGTSQTLRDTSLAERIERPLPERVQSTLPGGWRGSLSVSSYPKPTFSSDQVLIGAGALNK
jgi:hypothetical protein